MCACAKRKNADRESFALAAEQEHKNNQDRKEEKSDNELLQLHVVTMARVWKHAADCLCNMSSHVHVNVWTVNCESINH